MMKEPTAPAQPPPQGTTKRVAKVPKPEAPVYLTDPRKRIGRDYQQWMAGSIVTTPVKKNKYKVARRIDDGHAGVVFKVLNKKEQAFALKVPKKETEKQFRKLHQEVEKNKRLADLALPYANIVEEGGDYLVKEWVEGIRGDDWFIHWNEIGRPLNDPPWVELIKLFDRLSTRGIYVQNLKDLNMIWDGHKWIVIDVGYFKYDMRPEVALGRFYETFDSRWNKPKYNKPKGPFRYNCPTIAEIRGQGPECYSKRPPELIAKKRARMLARKLKAQQQAALEGAKLTPTPVAGTTPNGGKAVAPAGVNQTVVLVVPPTSEGPSSKEDEVSTEEKGSESGEKIEEELKATTSKALFKEDSLSEKEEAKEESEKDPKTDTPKGTKVKKSEGTKKKKKKGKKEQKEKKPKKVKKSKRRGEDEVLSFGVKRLSITPSGAERGGVVSKKKNKDVETKKPTKKKRKKELIVANA